MSVWDVLLQRGACFPSPPLGRSAGFVMRKSAPEGEKKEGVQTEDQ